MPLAVPRDESRRFESRRLLIEAANFLSAESSRNDGAISAAAGYPLEFGHYVATKSQPFPGQIDEVRLEQRALSADQIRQEFERQRKLVLTE